MKKYIPTIIISILMATVLIMPIIIAVQVNFMTIETNKAILNELRELKLQSQSTELEYSSTKAKIQELLNVLGVEDMEVSAYAPLDPTSIKGMCHDGDPNVTASGDKPIPGKTVAAPPHIPFGTKVWIEGLGIYRVNDRGGAIKGNRLDIVTQTWEEAIEFGRKNLKVVVIK